MGYFDDEYYDPAHFPELEEEMETLIDHVASTIQEEAIDHIVENSAMYQELKQVNKAINEERWDAIKNLSEAKKEIESLKTELSKKLNEHPHFKFQVGDKVYIPVLDRGYPKLACTKCNGTGRLVFNVQDAEIKEATAVCPLCGGYSRNGHVREGCYARFVPNSRQIVGISYNITKDHVTTLYSFEGNCSLREDEIAFDRTESVKICQEKTLQSYNIAAKSTGHPEVTSVDQIP